MITLVTCAAAFAPLVAPAAGPDGTASSGSAEFTFRTYRDWSLRLPAETFVPLGRAFPFELEGLSFPLALEGTSLAVDTDGDGVPDVRVTSEDTKQGRTALVVLDGKTSAGAAFRYAARVADRGGWAFAPSGAMVGKIGDTKIQLIDQNGNGTYDDVGEDAIVVGRGKSAAFLSRVIAVDGELLSLSISPDGRRVDFEPYTGERGHLDVVTAFDIDAKLETLVVRDESGAYSYELARGDGNTPVPAGRYLLHSGRMVLGDGSAEILPGRSEAIVVRPGETTRYEWGGPVEAEFVAHRDGSQLVFQPNEVWFFGAGGEEYRAISPPGLSPSFLVKERTTGEELIDVKFPGSC